MYECGADGEHMLPRRRGARKRCYGKTSWATLATRIATQRWFIRRNDERGPRRRSRDTSILRMPRSARERDRVAHVGKSGDVRERALEAEAEAGVRYRAVAAQVAVPA